ncbi:MAG TPA: lipopolysaccharide biosynthesis protein [Terriglobales bacterium]|nr:lipopolysaccharide biosynthesis protein [Terriglobales bacterium]
MIPFDASGAFHPVAQGGELRRLAVRGAAATISGAALSLGVQVVSTVVLARLLAPADFGVVAMVTTISMLLMSFGTSGFSEAVIQPKDVNQFQASNLFWITCAIGFILTLGFALSGSLLARFYRNPLVTLVTVVISASIFISALSTVHIALLRRAMRFSAVAANDVIARAVNTAVAVILALKGWGYWALVAGIVAQVLFATVGACWLCRWIPNLPRRGVGTRSMLRFAANVYGRFSANYFARNFDNVLVGWRFNAGALGYYKKAYDLFALSASQLTVPLHNVALAALSRLNHDRALFKRYLTNSLGVVAFVGMAVGADLTLVGRDLVRLVLGPNWSESGRIFELFGPGIGVMLLSSTVGWIHLSIGKPERWLRWTLVETGIIALSFIVALRWGPAGIAVAWSLSYWILFIPAFWYAGRPIDLGIWSLIGPIWRYAAASLVAGLGTAAVARSTIFWGAPADLQIALEAIVINSALFVALYLGTVVLLHRGFAPMQQLARLLRELAPSRNIGRAAAEPV